MDERVRPLKEQIKKQEEAAGNGVVNGDKDGGVDSRGLKRTLSGASGTSGGQWQHLNLSSFSPELAFLSHFWR